MIIFILPMANFFIILYYISIVIHLNIFLPTKYRQKCLGTCKIQYRHRILPNYKNEQKFKSICKQGFPGGTVVKNPPANAGDRFEPWSGKIPHAAEQLSPCATTTEPALQSPRATTTEAHAPTAHAPQQENPP